MKSQRLRSMLGIFFALACVLHVHQPVTDAAILRVKNSTLGVVEHEAAKKFTGLLCREPASAGGSDDVDVVLEEGGHRSLLFSRSVRDREGKVVGREVAGMQSTVHCATNVGAPDSQQCLPGDSEKPPTCAEIGKIGKCSCAAVVNEPLKLTYQKEMVSEALAQCKAKARVKEPFRVLMFGLGGGAMPMYLRHNCDSASIESVELDSRVALIAQRFFGFMPDSSNRVEIADGEEAVQRISSTHRHLRNQADPHYDAVLVDCFDGGSHVAPSCRSERFITAVHSLLKKGGKVVHNVMDTDMKQLLPMYQASFGADTTMKRAVQSGQFLIVASRV